MNDSYTYDVVFNDDMDSNSKHINSSYDECKSWIDCNRNNPSTYFGDYRGGTVSIVCIETGETVYEEDIP